MKFQEWFTKKLNVGRFPSLQWIKEHSYYDILINVSDEPYPPEISVDIPKKPTFIKVPVPNSPQVTIKHTEPQTPIFHWFPMNEMKKDMGLNAIYGACVILYYAEMKNKTVFLHCHGGANRSPTVQQAYYYMRKGEHLKDDSKTYVNRLVTNCTRGYLPPKAEMEKFLNALGKALKTGNSMGGQLCKIKIDTISNF